MTASYRTVQWNRHKRNYDLLLAGFMVLFLVAFVGVTLATHAPPNDIAPPVAVIRGLALLGIVMLHMILAIGPLARLDDRFAPLLYNRRHLGVSFFVVALLHALLATLYYGGFGVQNPITAMLAGYGSFDSISAFPFEVLGFFALLIFFVMAATSHDFWLANLSARVWKWIHMSVYVAYALVVLHVVLGALQSETNPLYAAALLAGVAGLTGLHVVAGLREAKRDAAGASPTAGEWVDACDVNDIAEGAATVVCLKGRERIAVFRHEGKLSAVANACAHQGGPLGEGRVIDGCITCPWHGYQYRPESGQSPPPYTEKIPTYEVRLEGRRVMVNPEANPPGTPVEPARIPAENADA